MNEWNALALEHKWVYDKLLVACAAGCICGPMGTPVPTPGNYVIRPITNLAGMGVGSYVEYIDTTDTPVKAGYFWEELLVGEHISVDYRYGAPHLVLRGDHPSHTTTKFTKWSRLATTAAPQLPPPLQRVCEQYSYFNAEFIGGKVIEVHCRVGGDSWIFEDASVVSIIPVWEDETVLPTDEFIVSPDEACVPRLGFKIVRFNTLID